MAGSWVALDLRVDRDGSVGEARRAAGSADSVATRAALECALGMRFYPARRGGEPVVAWARRRFEFAPR
jgi:TonB family protein